MKKLLLILTALIGFVSVPAYSQLKNMILIEEATNASCPSCAVQNPYFEQFLQNHSADVICVTYHAWWPDESEIMYLNDSAMNIARIIYYGFDTIGVPDCAVGGSSAPTSEFAYQGAPADTDGLILAVDSEMNVPSPVRMNVKRFVHSDSEEVRITLSATADLVNTTLRVVVVEGQHEYDDAGDNGETIFPNIARKMLPSSDGENFDLPAGAQKTFIYTYRYNPDWTTDQLRIVAFVQTDSNESVIAAVQTTDPPTDGSNGVSSESLSGFSMRVVGTPMSPTEKVDYSLKGTDPMKVTFFCR